MLLFLHIVWTEKPPCSSPPPEEATVLGIGVKNGFQEVVVEKEETVSLVLLHSSDSWDNSVEFHLEQADPDVQEAVLKVLEAKDATKKAELVQWSAAEETLIVSKYAEALTQKEAHPISPDPLSWRCYDSGSRDNLWLNLGTGVIGSGRANWDGSGGTGAALKHYKDTNGMYPLVVKLGTITPEGKVRCCCDL